MNALHYRRTQRGVGAFAVLLKASRQTCFFFADSLSAFFIEIHWDWMETSQQKPINRQQALRWQENRGPARSRTARTVTTLCSERIERENSTEGQRYNGRSRKTRQVQTDSNGGHVGPLEFGNWGRISTAGEITTHSNVVFRWFFFSFWFLLYRKSELWIWIVNYWKLQP